MLLLAHRGFHADVPENTMAAFEAAVRSGVDGIETDVRLSADGKLVIMHDRVTPQKRAVSEITHAELESDVGHAVPLLAEILDAFSDLLWNIEIKTRAAWPAASRVLADFQARRRLFVTSFRHDVIELCAAELNTDCGLLIADRPLNIAAVMAACAATPHIRSVVWDYNIMDREVLRAVSSAGWKNYAYGAVTSREHEDCLQSGLAGLITDYPLQILRPQLP
jgi:glycerophosphoryl diester phosphodiesterase